MTLLPTKANAMRYLSHGRHSDVTVGQPARKKNGECKHQNSCGNNKAQIFGTKTCLFEYRIHISWADSRHGIPRQ